MKYWIAMFPLLLAACANTVEVKDKDDFKCGEQIVRAEFLDDDSIILQINGVNNVLTKVAAASGKRYENIATQIVLCSKTATITSQLKDGITRCAKKLKDNGRFCCLDKKTVYIRSVLLLEVRSKESPGRD